MDEFDKKFAKLREHLELEKYPMVYMFKFIMPIDKVAEIKPIFQEGEITTKKSAKGNYISVTVKMVMFSAEHIIEKYRSMSHVKGVISL